MRRYFFHIYDGRTMPDEKGTELLDFNAARKEALQVAEGLIENAALRKSRGEEWRTAVPSAADTFLFRMDFRSAELEIEPSLAALARRGGL